MRQAGWVCLGMKGPGVPHRHRPAAGPARLPGRGVGRARVPWSCPATGARLAGALGPQSSLQRCLGYLEARGLGGRVVKEKKQRKGSQLGMGVLSLGGKFCDG